MKHYTYDGSPKGRLISKRIWTDGEGITWIECRYGRYTFFSRYKA